MSKRCKLQKEYYKEFGDYKGSGKYTDHYVRWLEYYVIELLDSVNQQSRLLELGIENVKDLRFLIDKFQTPKGNYIAELLMDKQKNRNRYS